MSGANCCDWKGLYWFSGETGPFASRKKAQMVFSISDDPKYGKSFGTPHVVDWDDDGIQDVVVVHKTDFWINTHSKGPVNREASERWKFKPLDFKFETHAYRQVSIADFNSDGRFDLIYSEELQGSIYVRLNVSQSGPPAFSAPIKMFQSPDGWLINSVTAVDLDQDGTMEIACGVYKKTDPAQGWVLESELWLLDR